MEQILTEISSFTTNWQIKRIDLTPRGDIIVALTETQTASQLIAAQYVTVNAIAGAIHLPTGPVVEYGKVNH